MAEISGGSKFKISVVGLSILLLMVISDNPKTMVEGNYRPNFCYCNLDSYLKETLVKLLNNQTVENYVPESKLKTSCIVIVIDFCIIVILLCCLFGVWERTSKPFFLKELFIFLLHYSEAYLLYYFYFKNFKIKLQRCRIF